MCSVQAKAKFSAGERRVVISIARREPFFRMRSPRIKRHITGRKLKKRREREGGVWRGGGGRSSEKKRRRKKYVRIGRICRNKSRLIRADNSDFCARPPFPISRCSAMQEIGRRVHTRVRKSKTPAREDACVPERGSGYRFIIVDARETERDATRRKFN